MANLHDVAKAVEQRAARKLARGTVDLPLPIFEGQYAGRFGVLDPERLAEFERSSIEGVFDDGEQSIEGAADFVADSCRQVLGRSKPSGPFEALTHEDGRPVRFDQEFAEALGLEAPEGRTIDSMTAVVLAVWCVESPGGKPEVNAAALDAFATRLHRWTRDTTQEVVGELAGESLASRP